MLPRIQLGLTSALLVLAACSTRTTSDGGDDNADSDDGDSSDSSDSGEDGSEGGQPDMGVPEPMCTPENYANDPLRGEYIALDCVPVEGDGTCAPCELECMTQILDDCEQCFESEEPTEPPYCINDCGDHLLLCSEQLGDQCCHLVTGNYVGGIPGRPLREGGTPRLPAARVLGEQSEAGRRYREFARYEQASVAAFSLAAAVLEQLGAPVELVEAHRVAAREEAEHARLALACAERLDGCAATLGELPEVGLDLELERFVCDLIHDGCVGELVAAREAAWALAQPRVREREPLRRYWRAVAIEEAGHAQLAWRTLEWLLATRPALGSVAARELALATAPRTWADDPGGDRGRDALGLASVATRAALREQAMSDLFASARAAAA